MLSGLRVVSRDKATAKNRETDSSHEKKSKKHKSKQHKSSESKRKHKHGRRKSKYGSSDNSGSESSYERISRSRKHFKSRKRRYSDPSSASESDSEDSEYEQKNTCEDLDDIADRNEEKDRAIAAREAAGLEWMVKAPKTTIRKPDEDITLAETKNEETFRVNPKELNPYLKSGGDGYPSDDNGTENLVPPKIPKGAVVGDGGLSWRLKALKRAKEQAEREGRELEKVVEERWGSLADMTVSVSARRAAHSRAHLHAIRDRKRNTDKSGQDGEVENKARVTGTGDEKDMERIDNSNRDYLKDVSVRDKRMRVPRNSESLSWRGGRGGHNKTIRREDEKIFQEAAGALNKFQNDGNFLLNFYNKEGANADEKTKNSEPETTEECNDKKTIEAKVAPNEAIEGMNDNQIAAKALQLRLSGKINEANDLMRQLENRKQQESSEQLQSTGEPRPESFSSKHSLENVMGEYNSRSRRDDSGDAGLAKSIVSNKLYNLSTCADDEYELGGAHFEDANPKKLRKKNSSDRDAKRAIQSHKRIITQEERCKFCFNNPSRPRHLTISIANACYLMIPPWEPIVEGHCLLVPMQHEGSSRNVDDNVWEELRNYKKCLLQMFADQDKNVIFIETAMNLAKQRRHCLIECIPLPPNKAKQAPLYFKKAIDEAEDEWSQHDAKKLIDTSGKGLRACIPKHFPYFNVDFGLNSGFVHVIDNEKEFRPEFGRNVIIGMLQLPEEEMHRRRKQQSFELEKRTATEFRKLWDKYDWTKMLD